MAQNNCLVCGDGCLNNSPKYPGLQECECCGFITAITDISDDELAALYGKDYFHGKGYSDYTRDKAAIQRNLSLRLDVISKFAKDSQNKLFEIGCAYGFFLEIAQTKFEKVKGVDISSDAVECAVKTFGVNAVGGNYLELAIEPYDICCMWDTIEHVREPDKFIEKISTEISQGGLLAITTGDIGSFNAKLRGKRWRLISPPIHLHYFSVQTLSKLLETNGFEVIHISHPGNLINLETALYIILVIQRKQEKLYKKIKRLLGKLANIYVPVNLSDIMYIVARKL